MYPIAVIVTAPQQPDELDLCLESFQQQHDDGFELLVADRPGTQRHTAVIERHARRMGDRIRHIVAPPATDSPEPGRAAVLNAAIASTQAEYLVFTEGNCLFQPTGLNGHRAAAEYGFFVHGEALTLDEKMSSQVNEALIATGQVFSPDWLLKTSPRWYKANFQSGLMDMVHQWWTRNSHKEMGWNLAVASGFRADIVGVNGFDSAVLESQLERDFSNRMRNYGLEPAKVENNGNALRLDNAWLDAPVENRGVTAMSADPGAEFRARQGLEELINK